MEDAFGHHVWASVQLLDACLALDPEQLATGVPGTYGSILDTARHLVGADASYLFVLSGERTPPIDEDHMDLHELRAQIEGHGAVWSQILAEDPDRMPSSCGAATTVPRPMPPSASGWRRRCTTGPITGARSAPR